MGSFNTNELAVVATQQVSNLGAGTHRIKFKMKADYEVGGTVEFGYLTNPSIDTSFVPLNSFSATSTTYQSYQFSPPAGVYSDYPAFRHTGVVENSVLIDYVVWETIPTCLDVDGLAVGGISSSGANISWDISTGVIGYEYAVTTSITPPLGGTSTTGTSASITSLVPQTVYYLQVRSACTGNNFGAWSTVSFTTSCSVSSIPYTQDFESALYPNFPLCTTQQNIGAGNLWEVTNTINGFGWTSKVLRYDSEAAEDVANVWFYTNGINLLAGINYQIAYDYGATFEDFPHRFKVAYGTAASANAMTNQLADHPNVVNVTPINNIVNFTPTTSGVYYFGFNAYSLPNQLDLFVDNISLDVALANNSFDNNNFLVYPNPVKNILNINHNENISKIQILNILGQEIITKLVNDKKNQIDMSSLVQGTYLVKITSNDLITIIKIIKE